MMMERKERRGGGGRYVRVCTFTPSCLEVWSCVCVTHCTALSVYTSGLLLYVPSGMLS